MKNAVALGVDALGFVFVEASSRCVKTDQVNQMIAQTPPFVQTVGLFMNSSAQEVREVLKENPLNLLQFHGDETPAFCAQFDMPYIKAIPMGGGVAPLTYAARHTAAIGFLLDSHALGESGGSGYVFDWRKIPSGFKQPLILAGGLTVSNVCEAVRQVRPYAVDVSSGVEVAKGLKDQEKMAAFVKGVRDGDK